MIDPSACAADGQPRPDKPGAPRTLTARPDTPADLFASGRTAAALARTKNDGRGVFCRSRQLLATGAWRGPRDAPLAFVEEEDLVALGGLAAAVETGVRTLVVSCDRALFRQAAANGLGCLWRLPFAQTDSPAHRSAQLDDVRARLVDGATIDGVIPTPIGEPFGLDTLDMVAACRLHLPVTHVLADFARLGHRLAQMCLGFGADELFGPIVAERALRLGDNANNPAMTRKEAATLLRGAGLTPTERGADGTLEPFLP